MKNIPLSRQDLIFLEARAMFISGWRPFNDRPMVEHKASIDGRIMRIDMDENMELWWMLKTITWGYEEFREADRGVGPRTIQGREREGFSTWP